MTFKLFMNNYVIKGNCLMKTISLTRGYKTSYIPFTTVSHTDPCALVEVSAFVPSIIQVRTKSIMSYA